MDNVRNTDFVLLVTTDKKACLFSISIDPASNIVEAMHMAYPLITEFGYSPIVYIDTIVGNALEISPLPLTHNCYSQ